MPLDSFNADGILSAVVDATSDGDNTIIAAPGPGLRIRVLGFVLVADAAGAFLLQSDLTANTETVKAKFEPTAAGEGVSFAGSVQGPAFTCSANQALVLNTTASQDVSGFVSYILV